VVGRRAGVRSHRAPLGSGGRSSAGTLNVLRSVRLGLTLGNRAFPNPRPRVREASKASHGALREAMVPSNILVERRPNA
jgi:hypothetical protein